MARALGIDDSITTCDCCGKSNLKHTVAIELDDGEVVHYGSVCATRNTGKASKVIAAEIRTEAQRVVAAASAELKASAEHIAYRAKLALRDRERTNLIGKSAFEFVKAECIAEAAACVRIAAKHGLKPWQVSA